MSDKDEERIKGLVTKAEMIIVWITFMLLFIALAIRADRLEKQVEQIKIQLEEKTK